MARLIASALVLAAGRGTRLDPLTRLVAKAVVPLAGQTLLERVLGQLASVGIRHVVVNLHHRPETIAGVVGDGRQFGLTVRYSWEGPELLGSAGGPRHALSLLGPDPILMANADTLVDADVDALATAYQADGVTMALVPNPAPDRYGGVILDEADRVTAFVPRGSTAMNNWHFVGLQVVSASVFADLPDNVPAETTTGLYRELLASQPGRVRGWRTRARAFDVGTPRDYLSAALAMSGDDIRVVEPGATVASSATLDRVLVWPQASVGEQVRLTRCIVAGDVRLPAGFAADDAILLPPAVVRPGDSAQVRQGVAVFPLS